VIGQCYLLLLTVLIILAVLGLVGVMPMYWRMH
jgi:hypothetical protein